MPQWHEIPCPRTLGAKWTFDQAWFWLYWRQQHRCMHSKFAAPVAHSRYPSTRRHRRRRATSVLSHSNASNTSIRAFGCIARRFERSLIQSEARRQGIPTPSGEIVCTPAYGSAEAKELGAACMGGTAMRRLSNAGSSCEVTRANGCAAGSSDSGCRGRAPTEAPHTRWRGRSPRLM